jgi:hypothetical protein
MLSYIGGLLYGHDGQTNVSYQTDLVDVFFEYSINICEYS